jgi:hypothetical protein
MIVAMVMVIWANVADVARGRCDYLLVAIERY